MDKDLKEFANILFAPRERDELQERINKAIEYCKNGIKEYITDDGFVEEVLQDVLNILKGSNSNE